MNKPKLVIDKLDHLIKELREDQSEAEKAALYSAIRWCINDLEEYAKDQCPYILEKLGDVQWHTGAMLGYDITNGHDYQQHREWALAEIQVIKRPFK